MLLGMERECAENKNDRQDYPANKNDKIHYAVIFESAIYIQFGRPPKLTQLLILNVSVEQSVAVLVQIAAFVEQTDYHVMNQ